MNWLVVVCGCGRGDRRSESIMDWLVVVCGCGRGDRYGLGVLSVLNKCGVVC